jgi:hypothetical protein
MTGTSKWRKVEAGAAAAEMIAVIEIVSRTGTAMQNVTATDARRRTDIGNGDPHTSMAMITKTTGMIAAEGGRMLMKVTGLRRSDSSLQFRDSTADPCPFHSQKPRNSGENEAAKSAMLEEGEI